MVFMGIGMMVVRTFDIVLVMTCGLIIRVVVWIGLVGFVVPLVLIKRLTSPGTFIITQRASCTNTLYVMMVTVLRFAYLILKAKNLCSIFTHLAVHKIIAMENLFNSIFKCLNNQGVIVQIRNFNKLNVGKFFCDNIGRLINSIDQDTGK